MKIQYNRLISPRSMVKIILTLSLTLFFEITNAQQVSAYPDTTGHTIDLIKAEKAKSVALKYIRFLTKGESIDSILSLCSVPFSWDKREIISEQAALKQKHIDMIANTHKNSTFSVDTVFVNSTRKEILDKVIPLDVYSVMVKIKVKSPSREKVYSVLFAIQMSDNPKIIGYTD